MNLLITGSGTLAQALLKRCPDATLYSRSEYTFARMIWEANAPIKGCMGDIRDFDQLYRAIVDSGAEYVIHTAAMKQVGSGAANALECASVNVQGTATVVRACQQAGIPMLFTSSDKAVAPTNTYGKAKALAEDIVLGAGFTVTRWGNVIRSRGSVLERWERTGEIIVTNPDWTRYWLTRDEAAEFVLWVIAGNPSVYIKESKAASMRALAVAAANIFAIPYHSKVDASREVPGEKPHETLDGRQTSADVDRYTVDELTDIIRHDRERWPL